jgi:hypothetical protein
MKKTDHHLVQQVLDGEVTREAFDGFQQRLRAEPELVDLYGGYALLQHSLSEEFEGGPAPEHGQAVRSRRLAGIPVLLVFAAALAIAGTILWFQPFAGSNKGYDVAVVTFSVDAVWQFEGASRNLGGATGVDQGSKLHLRQGRAGISLEPSVTAVIEGPADVTFLAKDSLHLTQGRGFFTRGGTGGGLTITTPKLTAVDSGTEFGIDVPVAGPDELHVKAGKVEVVSKAGNESALLVAGDAVRVPATGPMERFAAGGRHFATGLGRFQTVLSAPFNRSDWRLEYGNPSFSDTRIEGANYAAFLQFPEPQPSGENSVLLATLEVGKPVGGEFHTDGWAGISFFSNGAEVLFFGDSFGTKPTWSLDVKQRIPVILPEQPLTGPRTVTLRYDRRSGEASLHDGGVPLKTPFCVGNLPAGTRFDEIRIGASSGAALTVNSLHVKVGGE